MPEVNIAITIALIYLAVSVLIYVILMGYDHPRGWRFGAIFKKPRHDRIGLLYIAAGWLPLMFLLVRTHMRNTR